MNSRPPVIAQNVIATSQHLAAQAGIELMKRGGNAIDGAIAGAIALAVVEPVSNGVGGDLFAIVWDGQKAHGINASGASPSLWSVDRFRGKRTMPLTGWDSVTVPGVVSGWAALSKQFGALPFQSLFEPAIDYARNGFPLGPVVAAKWTKELHRLKTTAGFAETFAPIFAPKGVAPAQGEVFRNPDLARSLEWIAQSGGKDFYEGDIAKAIGRSAKSFGAVLSYEDLKAHRSESTNPLSTRYRDCEVLELPPNTQGIVALIALAILQGFDVARDQIESVRWTHLQVEAIKLAFAHSYAHLGDVATLTPNQLVRIFEPLVDIHKRGAMRERIDPSRAQDFGGGKPPWGGTVYLTSADSEGRMVSLIQSTFFGFGAGIAVPRAGIHLNNRGACFSLEPGHPNCVAGNKRPLQTIIPAMVLRQGNAWASLGVTGGPVQPQGHVQLLTRLIDGGWDVQRAIDSPRWKVEHANSSVQLDFETSVASSLVSGLRDLGHRSDVPGITGLDFGGAFAVQKLNQSWAAGSDARRDGAAVGF
jgi:gamma-glutamyltranspeptidase / glutathione hydrolase